MLIGGVLNCHEVMMDGIKMRFRILVLAGVVLLILNIFQVLIYSAYRLLGTQTFPICIFCDRLQQGCQTWWKSLKMTMEVGLL